MIKYFRNIRQSLAAEGDSGRYFKYAIGEIALVVIGILIALQLNNLNEQRKNNIFEKEILAQIQENLKNDKEVLAEIETNFNNAINSANKILSAKVSKETADSINVWLGAIIQFDRFQPLTNAYDVIKSSGLNKISNKQLRFLLGRYYDDKALRIIKSTNDIEIAFHSHWIPILFEETVEFEFKKSVVLKDYSLLLKSSKERNILVLNRDNYASGISKVKDGLEMIDEVQNLITMEIK